MFNQYISKGSTLWLYHFIYYALHENDNKNSIFGDLVIEYASYSSFSVRKYMCDGGTFFNKRYTKGVERG